MANEYTSESIKVLSAIEHIKTRKGMYIGDASDARQLLSEVVDNANDEVQAGFSDELIVTIDTNANKYTVRDFGRGIPHGMKTLDNGVQKEVLEVLLTVSNSGGKFDNTSYNYSSGLNGLGITITNALSKEIVITSYRKGKFVKATAHSSDKVDIEYGTTTEHDGTEVTFIPDKQHFKHEKIPVEFILDRCKVASALGFRARLIVDGEELKTDANMFDLIKEENTTLSTYVNVQPIEVISTTAEKMKVAIRYTSDTTDRYFGYTNLLSNYLGGTHVQELSRTLVTAWREFIDKHKNIKPAVELHNNDYLVGLRGVCAVFISHTEFSSQTKEKLVVNKKYFEELMGLFKSQFIRYLEDNIVIAQQLIKRFEEYRIAQNNLLSRKEISSLIKVNNDGEDNIRRRSIVSKLVECTSRKRKDTELFIVEGDSAKGPFLFTRNKELQAVLPLRGKILNITNKSIKEAVKNSEICDIANAMGCGIGAACDASKSRYERIVISADADPDGLQINCLVLSVFINLFPDMVKQGRVYISMPPLYCWGDSPKNYGWCNKVEDIPKTVKEVTRFKGLGEMENSQLKYFLVDPSTRNTLQVQYPADVDEFNRILGSSEGKRDLLTDLGIIEKGE
jgi:DNA gyrase/topoisomerase IV subunit B